ncbi:MAG: hypothetical protein ACFBRM_00760 [Pikeienuella sp.]
MTVIAWIGLGLTALGLCLIIWCILRAGRLKKAELAPEAAKDELSRIFLLNNVAVSTAFLGLGMMLLGLML